MGWAIFLLVLAIPMLEIGVLIKVGQAIGVLQTFLIIIGTAMLGIIVLQRQGFQGAIKMQEALRRGETPVGAMVDSGLVMLAGVLLITPGLIADTLGLFLLIPPVRRLAAYLFAKSMTYGVSVTQWTVRRDGASAPGGRMDPNHDAATDATPQDGPIIEGEFRRVEERTIGRKPGAREGDKSG